jgi:hypothetical protein
MIRHFQERQFHLNSPRLGLQPAWQEAHNRGQCGSIAFLD